MRERFPRLSRWNDSFRFDSKKKFYKLYAASPLRSEASNRRTKLFWRVSTLAPIKHEGDRLIFRNLFTNPMFTWRGSLRASPPELYCNLPFCALWMFVDPICVSFRLLLTSTRFQNNNLCLASKSESVSALKIS